jgi:hypothetical protein
MCVWRTKSEAADAVTRMLAQDVGRGQCGAGEILVRRSVFENTMKFIVC